MKRMQALVLIYLLMGLASAADVYLTAPTNANTCVLGQAVNFSYTPNQSSITHCNLFTNQSGLWAIYDTATNISALTSSAFLNEPLSPGTYLWGVTCGNATSNMVSSNFSFSLKNVAYCAILSETTCPLNPNVNSMTQGKTRLSNSRGFYLENQDCNVYITDADGNPVKAFDTMLYMQDVSVQLDKDGNTVNVADKKVPLTDAAGYYVFPFLVDRDWAWVGANYSLVFSCNGIVSSCNFTVDKDRLPDMNNYDELGKEAGGIILFLILAAIAFVSIIGYLIYLWRKRTHGS
jgi:hypothetical protein